VVWTPTPLATVTLKGALTLSDGTTTSGPGSTTRSVGVELSHALLRNLTIAATANLARTDYQLSTLVEDGFTGGVKIEYRPTRTFAVRASFTHEQLKSTTPGADYTANVYRVGLRLQY
jgi:hypothetical protein